MEIEYILPPQYLFCYKKEKFLLKKFYNLKFPSKDIIKDIEKILKKRDSIILKMIINDDFRKLVEKLVNSLIISHNSLVEMTKEYIKIDTNTCREDEIPLCYLESLEEIVKYYVMALTGYSPKDVILIVNSIEEIPELILDVFRGKYREFLRFIKESIAYSIPFSRLQLLKEILEKKYDKKIEIEYQL